VAANVVIVSHWRANSAPLNRLAEFKGHSEAWKKRGKK